MLQFPDIDPVIFKIGPLSMRWYGLMYILGFVSSYLLVTYQVKKKALKKKRSIGEISADPSRLTGQ